MRDRGCEVKAASSIQPLPAAVELTQENIYFPELLRIDNLLSVRLYEMEREAAAVGGERDGSAGQKGLNWWPLAHTSGRFLQLLQTDLATKAAVHPEP